MAADSSASSKKALRQQRQRANKQKRKAEVGLGSSGAAAKRPRVAELAEVLGAEAYREAHHIVVKGECPAPFETFSCAAAEFGDSLVKQLRKQGFVAPTAIQAQAWPIALSGQDLVAVSETGSGKTCAFLLPALARIYERRPAQQVEGFVSARPSALVLAPTRELVQQISGEVNKFLVGPVERRPRQVAVFGGVDKLDQIKRLRKGADILIATPGRLLDFATGDPEKQHKPSVKLRRVTYLVMDEADRMLDMGFEPDIRKIVSMCPETAGPQGSAADGESELEPAKRRQTLFFTATWPKAVKHAASAFTAAGAAEIRLRQASGDKLTVNTMVSQTVFVLDPSKKLKRLRKLLAAELQPSETAIVFVNTKETCDLVERELQSIFEGWCSALHGGREQKQRDAALRKFRALTLSDAGEKGVLVATDVAARGLDIPGVALVVVYDFGGGDKGGGVQTYVHRIGRTARAGRSGRAVTFFTLEDKGAAELAELLRDASQIVPPSLQELVDQCEW